MAELYESVGTQSREAGGIPAVAYFLQNILYQIIIPLLTEASSLQWEYFPVLVYCPVRKYYSTFRSAVPEVLLIILFKISLLL